MLTKQDLLLVGKLLEMASETYSNHECNDLSEDILSLISDEKTLCEEIREWIGDSDCPQKADWIGDDTLMSFLSDKILKEAKRL